MYVLLNAVSVETYASGATWLGLTDGYEIPSVCCELNLSPSARRVQAFNVWAITLARECVYTTGLYSSFIPHML